MANKNILENFGYDQNIMLSVESQNFRLPFGAGTFYTFELSAPFEVFLKKTFLDVAKSKYFINEEEIAEIFEPINEVHLGLFLENFPFFKRGNFQIRLCEWLFFWR